MLVRGSTGDQRKITELLNHGFIQESYSPFASPVTLQFNKTGEGALEEKTRLCVHFQDLNKLLVPESQPFPLIEDLITITKDCAWFSALDINSAFWSIPVRHSDRHKTRFVTTQRHYEWSCMLFGLKNSPAVFQRILSGIICRHKLDSFCTNYIDDILVFSKSFEIHLTHLKALINAIRPEGFWLKFIKCDFDTRSISMVPRPYNRI